MCELVKHIHVVMQFLETTNFHKMKLHAGESRQMKEITTENTEPDGI